MGLLRYYLDGLAHFFAAHSRHGTHSPFVYQLLDEVIYPKRLSDEPRDKLARLVKRLIDRFQPGEVYTPDSEPPPTSPIDFALVDCGTCETPGVEVEAVWPQFHAGSVLVLSDVYRDNGAKALWQFIKAQPDVTVTIDLFRAGLVFFRPGQAKEDFKIRY